MWTDVASSLQHVYLATAVHLVGSRPMDVVVGKVDKLPAHILGGGR